MITVEEARSGDDLQAVRQLFRAFVAWHRLAHAADIALIDRYFDDDAFEAELDGLPGYYAAPAGRLLIARLDGAPAGCVAMRDLGEGNCEMKRMFVPDEFRGQGVGRELAATLVAEARKAGYARMRLDTSWRQAAAMGLYESLGFRKVSPYYDLPADLTDWLVFFECEL